MWMLLSTLTLADLPAPPEPQEIVVPQSVRSLPGQLDSVPVFNSNSPELVQMEGILLSTFPPMGMADPSAHLDFAFQGRFDIFAHHVYRAVDPEDLTSLYIGIVAYNPGDDDATISILHGASYLSQPDAPFFPLPPLEDNARGDVFAGPGSRVMSDVLRNRRQEERFPAQVTIPPGQYRLLLNEPIPVAELDPPLNGRSTLMRLRSDQPIYLASLAHYADVLVETDADADQMGDPDAEMPRVQEQAPSLEDWVALLETGDLAGGRDRPPTPLGAPGQIIYGRVAGVAQGSQWDAFVSDTPESANLTIPEPGEAVSYGLSTLVAGRLGTGQVQTAPMLVRYPDTAYQAHGNYGIQYNLFMPLHNPSAVAQTVTLSLQTPIKEDVLTQDGLRFFDPLPTQTFFRGTVQVSYVDDDGRPQSRFFHLVQRRGDQSEPLVTLTLPPGDRRSVEVSFLYPPDSTPPQVLTLRTLLAGED
ncbi:MAG: DUF3370 domain-containing protein [Leptolyngbya sp. DLM2.Bin15]|nr:MAG: DUF3370 domain-containing protein [Leptolyngbya sp. DLM2.Bin15]